MVATVAQAQVGRQDFEHVFSLADGTGPLFNERSCGACHNFPSLGGTEGGCAHCMVRRVASTEPGGPVLQRESVAIETGAYERCSEAPTSKIKVAQRRPTQLFGAGLIEAISDQDILKVAAEQKTVSGRAHMVTPLEAEPHANERVGRFGWKAQFATLESATAEALRTEIGITTTLLSTEETPYGEPARLVDCDTVPDPEDRPGVDGLTRLDKLVAFQQTLAAPIPSAKLNSSGQRLFNQIGCAECHHPAYHTPDDPKLASALRNKAVAAYSDFLLHDMGQDGDGIADGNAKPSEMRTAPLWGLRFRFPNGNQLPGSLYHDRREFPNLIKGILDHSHDRANESNASVDRFARLSQTQQQAIAAFLMGI